MKENAAGTRRELAKQFLNNLYGKMASSTSSSFKVAYDKGNGVLGFYTQPENDKLPGFIAVGSAITSYARNFTIRAAQANYYGPDKPGFIYADTDSIHCDLPSEEIKGITVHPKKFLLLEIGKLLGYWMVCPTKDVQGENVMDVIKFINERRRMCKSYSGCGKCQLNGKACGGFLCIDAEETVSCVEKWPAAHPLKTHQSVFLEQYPNAMLDSKGIITICPESIYGEAVCPKKTENCRIICYDCRHEFWMQEVK